MTLNTVDPGFTTDLDRPPRLGLTLVAAIVGFALGLGAVVQLAPRRETPPIGKQTPARAPKSDVTKPETAAPAAPKQASVTTSPTAAPPAASSDSPSSATTAAVASPAAPPIAASHPTTTAQSSPKPEHAPAELTFIQGRVAYLRCDGLRAADDRFPCPRDPALEEAVWAILSALPKCVPSLGRGGIDVRLDCNRGMRSEVRLLDIPGSPEPALDSRAVYACVGNRLARLKTQLDPIYMVVSFRALLR